VPLPPGRIFDPLRGKPLRWLQRRIEQSRHDHRWRNLLVLSQPKSGSTWLARMLAAVEGYRLWNPRGITFASHDLPTSWASRPPTAGWTVTKTHTSPTRPNRDLVAASGRPFVVLVRDLRDVAVSWTFYVANTPDHPQHEIVAPLAPDERLDHFIETMLPWYRDWTLGWLEHLAEEGASGRGMLVRYEHLLDRPVAVFSDVLDHFEIGLSRERIERIVADHSFERMAGGRRRGEEDASAFVRKGVAGNWREHFAPRHGPAFDVVASPALVALGTTRAGERWWAAETGSDT